MGDDSKQIDGDGYQKYMKQYAGDYQQYMNQGGQGGQQSQGADYQQYMKQYAGDYQKYMNQGSQGGQQSQGGDYQQYMKQYVGDYQKYMNQGSQGGQQLQETPTPVNLVAMDADDSNQNNGKGYQKYYESYMPDVKNWSNNDEVRDAFTKTYAGSYVNISAAGSTHDSGDAFKNKYAGKYLPADVKNWSDSKEVRDAFMKTYAGSYTNLNAVKSNKSFNRVPSQLSDSMSGRRLFNELVEPHAAIVTASREATDTNAAIKMSSVPEQGTQTLPHVSLFIAATLFVVGAALLHTASKSRRQPLLDPLLDVRQLGPTLGA